MSVDTYLKRKNLSTYRSVQQEDATIHVSEELAGWAAALGIGLRKFLFWTWLAVDLTPLQEHAHGSA